MKLQLCIDRQTGEARLETEDGEPIENVTVVLYHEHPLGTMNLSLRVERMVVERSGRARRLRKRW